MECKGGIILHSWEVCSDTKPTLPSLNRCELLLDLMVWPNHKPAMHVYACKHIQIYTETGALSLNQLPAIISRHDGETHISVFRLHLQANRHHLYDSFI